MAACVRLLDRKAVGVDWPASRSRRSVRVRFDDGAVIATLRKDPRRSRLEYEVLRALHENGAPVPEPLAYDGQWLIQENLEGVRLAHALTEADDGQAHDLLDRAAAGLSVVHRIGGETGIADRVVRLGAKDSWIARFVDTPNRIGETLGVAAPALDIDALVARLRAGPPCFVKWDARPGNAIVRADGSVAWFDWEHCGARNGLDDFAWLLADEYAPDIPGIVDIAADHAPAGLSGNEVRDYYRTYASFHTSVRLALVVHHKGDGEWWDEEMVLADDKIRVTPAGARILCGRGAALAAGTKLTAPLAGWFAAVAERLGVVVGQRTN